MGIWGRVGPHQESESLRQVLSRDSQLATEDIPWPTNSPGCRVPVTFVNSPSFLFSNNFPLIGLFSIHSLCSMSVSNF